LSSRAPSTGQGAARTGQQNEARQNRNGR
jgi:hypothetical protein